MSRHVEYQPHDEVFNVSDEDGADSESAGSDDGGRVLGKSADNDDKSNVVTNQPFDEAVDLSASDGSSAGSSPHNPAAAVPSRSPAAVASRQTAAPVQAVAGLQPCDRSKVTLISTTQPQEGGFGTSQTLAAWQNFAMRNCILS